MAAIDSQSLITRLHHAEFIELDPDRGVLLDPRAGSYFEFNATGGAVWKALENPARIDQIVAHLSAEFGGVVSDDVTEFVEQLTERGLAAITP